MLWIVERISAYYLPSNMSNDPRLEFLDHPGTCILSRNWIWCLELRYPSWGKSILRVIPGMANNKNQLNVPCLQLFEPFFDKLSSNALTLIFWVYR